MSLIILKYFSTIKKPCKDGKTLPERSRINEGFEFIILPKGEKPFPSVQSSALHPTPFKRGQTFFARAPATPRTYPYNSSRSAFPVSVRKIVLRTASASAFIAASSESFSWCSYMFTRKSASTRI